MQKHLIIARGRVKKALLHHSPAKLAWIAAKHPAVQIVQDDANSSFASLQHEDFPILKVTYRQKPLFFGTSRMFVEPTLWVTEALVQGGVRYIIKLGTFVAYDDTVAYGDIVVPDSAVVLHGAISAYVGRKARTVNADKRLTALIHRLAESRNVRIRGGQILTYTLRNVRRKMDPDYDPDAVRYRRECVGMEMECSALFAVAQYYQRLKVPVGTAALLVCNRKWRDVKAKNFGQASKDANYHQGYWSAVNLALEALFLA